MLFVYLLALYSQELLYTKKKQKQKKKHVTGPTRVQQDGSSSTVDLLFSNEESLVHKCETVPPLSTSDHFGVVSIINKKFGKQRIRSKGCRIWRYSYVDWDGACEAIDDFDWDSIMSNDIDVACENWLKQFMSIMEQFTPNCLLKSRQNLPWLTKPLMRLIRKKNLLFKKAKSARNFNRYKIHHNRTLAELRAAKKSIFSKAQSQ